MTQEVFTFQRFTYTMRVYEFRSTYPCRSLFTSHKVIQIAGIFVYLRHESWFEYSVYRKIGDKFAYHDLRQNSQDLPLR